MLPPDCHKIGLRYALLNGQPDGPLETRKVLTPLNRSLLCLTPTSFALSLAMLHQCVPRVRRPSTLQLPSEHVAAAWRHCIPKQARYDTDAQLSRRRIAVIDQCAASRQPAWPQVLQNKVQANLSLAAL